MGVPGLFAYLRRRYPQICSIPDPPRKYAGAAAAADDTIDPSVPIDNLYIDMCARRSASGSGAAVPYC